MHCGLSWFHSMDTVKPEITAHCTLANAIADGCGAIRTARGKLKPTEAMFSKKLISPSLWACKSKGKDLPSTHSMPSSSRGEKALWFPSLLQVFDVLRYEQPVWPSTVPIFQPFLKNSIKHPAMCSMDWAQCSPDEILLISACVELDFGP